MTIYGSSGFERPDGWVGGEGPPDATCMIVGEAPGPGEWEAFPKRPFIGKAGTLLFNTLPLDRRLLYVTNVVKEFPPNDGRTHESMTPTPEQINFWSPYLDAEIANLTNAHTRLGGSGTKGAYRKRTNDGACPWPVVRSQATNAGRSPREGSSDISPFTHRRSRT